MVTDRQSLIDLIKEWMKKEKANVLPSICDDGGGITYYTTGSCGCCSRRLSTYVDMEPFDDIPLTRDEQIDIVHAIIEEYIKREKLPFRLVKSSG